MADYPDIPPPEWEVYVYGRPVEVSEQFYRVFHVSSILGFGMSPEDILAYARKRVDGDSCDRVQEALDAIP